MKLLSGTWTNLSKLWKRVHRTFLVTYAPPWLELQDFIRSTLLYDGESCHRSHLVKTYFEQKRISIISTPTPTPLYPNLQTCDFNRFGFWKKSCPENDFPIGIPSQHNLSRKNMDICERVISRWLLRCSSSDTRCVQRRVTIFNIHQIYYMYQL